ncbi:MAG TPA: hypothetical protein PK874_07325 [Desulfobacteraceae bacterium]|nr:hypothetical protein [Desulfobacteraceae bacterium]HPJ68714.1 hypothetical protein [Desulfobacteraceae bacterium]HPQ28077.1 hypothetical protein [Desulfobacteraceae bacterium]
MKILNRKILLGSLLIALSGLFYLIHYVIFKDAHHIFIYMIGDIAFVFVEVFMVTLIIHELMKERDKRIRMEKLNMVIGAFFSETGTKLLTYFSDLDPKLDKIRDDLIVNDNWSKQDFQRVYQSLKYYVHEVDIHKVDIDSLRNFLIGQKDFFLRLLENPSLLEHESFTELLRAIFHLTEELALAGRKDLLNLPAVNYEHLSGDIKRAYSLLIYQWLDYMKYLKNNYPYLFSLAMRTNPFDQKCQRLENPLSEEE